MASQRNGGEVKMQDLENHPTAPNNFSGGTRGLLTTSNVPGWLTTIWSTVTQSPALPQNAGVGTHDTPLPPDHTASNSRWTPITESSAANNNNNQLPGPSSNRLENSSQTPDFRSRGTNNSNDHPKSPAPTTIPESNQTLEPPVGSPRNPTRRNTEHTVSGRSSNTNSPGRNPTSQKSPKPNSTPTSSGSQTAPPKVPKPDSTSTPSGSQNPSSNPTPPAPPKKRPTHNSPIPQNPLPPRKQTLIQKFSHKETYCGIRRLYFALISALVLTALILGLGLSFGLHHHNPSSPSSPSSFPPNPESYAGSLTYFLPSSSPPFCSTIPASQNINTVAISPALFSSTTTTDTSLCGAKLRAWRFDTDTSVPVPASGAGSGSEEKSVEVMVVDKCASCAERDICVDLGAFEQLADSELELGRVDVMWEWL